MGVSTYVCIGVSSMGLPTPPEPKDIKELIKSVRNKLGTRDNPPGIEWDSLSVWIFNRLPKYLWDAWKSYLRDRGITWQVFLKILKLHTIDIIEWTLRENLSWEELVKRIESSIENYSSRGSNTH